MASGVRGTHELHCFAQHAAQLRLSSSKKIDLWGISPFPLNEILLRARLQLPVSSARYCRADVFPTPVSPTKSTGSQAFTQPAMRSSKTDECLQI